MRKKGMSCYVAASVVFMMRNARAPNRSLVSRHQARIDALGIPYHLSTILKLEKIPKLATPCSPLRNWLKYEVCGRTGHVMADWRATWKVSLVSELGNHCVIFVLLQSSCGHRGRPIDKPGESIPWMITELDTSAIRPSQGDVRSMLVCIWSIVGSCISLCILHGWPSHYQGLVIIRVLTSLR